MPSARTDPNMLRFREATRADAMAVARLHAESWRVHYRGAYRDAYLDGDVVEDRIRVEGRPGPPASVSARAAY